MCLTVPPPVHSGIPIPEAEVSMKKVRDGASIMLEMGFHKGPVLFYSPPTARVLHPVSTIVSVRGI